MRFIELRNGGERPFVLDFHPQLTLLSGLGDEGRRWMAALLARALRGELADLEGVVDVHGVSRELTESLIAELALPSDLDVLVRAGDLPGARPIDLDADDDAAREVDRHTLLQGLQAAASELSQARLALARATENREHAELVLAEAEGNVGDAVDVGAAETALEAARARRDRAAQRVEEAMAAQPSDERRDMTARRAHLAGQRAELESRRQGVVESLDAIPTADPSDVAAALAARRAYRADDAEPIPAALALADELDTVEVELEALPEPPPPNPSLLADAERELDAARVEVAAAEAVLAQRQVSPEDAARVDELHAEVLDAEEKAERRLAAPGARKRVKDASRAEEVFLATLGFSSYSDYLLNTSALIADPAAPMRLGQARRRLADAEIVLDELHGRRTRELREAAEERQVALLTEARHLLGGTLPDPPDVSAALRALRRPATPPDDGPLLAALHQAGVDLDTVDDAVTAAERFLADADEAHARRAALQAELSAIGDDLAQTIAEIEALPVLPPDEAEDDLDQARAELQAAQEAEQAAQRAAVAVRAAAADDRAARSQVESLRADLAGALAAEQQAGARVKALEVRLAEAEAAHEQARRAEAEAARSAALLDLTEVERGDIEVYLLARIAAQRDVGHAGSLPLVITDALVGLPPDTTQSLLNLVERFAPVVQFVVMSDDPDIEEWARSFGADASVRRFSYADV